MEKSISMTGVGGVGWGGEKDTISISIIQTAGMMATFTWTGGGSPTAMLRMPSSPSRSEEDQACKRIGPWVLNSRLDIQLSSLAKISPTKVILLSIYKSWNLLPYLIKQNREKHGCIIHYPYKCIYIFFFLHLYCLWLPTTPTRSRTASVHVWPNSGLPSIRTTTILNASQQPLW